jgi:hypothetical protein
MNPGIFLDTGKRLTNLGVLQPRLCPALLDLPGTRERPQSSSEEAFSRAHHRIPSIRGGTES